MEPVAVMSEVPEYVTFDDTERTPVSEFAARLGRERRTPVEASWMNEDRPAFSDWWNSFVGPRLSFSVLLRVWGNYVFRWSIVFRRLCW